MSSYVLVAASSAVEGRDDDYNEWYDTIHIQDLLAIPGINSARRFEATPFGMSTPPGKYLAIYEIETDDIAGVMGELGRRAAAGEMRQSDALDAAAAQLWVYAQR